MQPDRPAMRTVLLASVAAGVFSGVVPAAQPSPDPGLVPQAEINDVAILPPPGPHRLLVGGGFRGGGVQVVDGDSGKVQGQFYATNASNLVVDPKDRFYYLAETAWTHGNRGARQDYVSIYDTQLKLVAEVGIPGRLIAVPKSPTFDISADGRYGYVFDMQPASSVHVIDLQTRKLSSTVEIPGCGMVYPFGTTNFAALCADGSMATAIRGARSYAVTRSERFFDAENDPIYEESLVDRATGKALFLSYTGQVWSVKLGEKPVIAAPWTLMAAAGLPAASTATEQVAWRPGGSRLAAWHLASNRLFVLMHVGTHWTHKEAGNEIWVFDTEKHQRVARWALKGKASSIAVTQDAAPLLFVTGGGGPDGPGGVDILDARSGEELRKVAGVSGSLLGIHGY